MNIRSQLISRSIYDLIDGFVNAETNDSRHDLYFGLVVSNLDPENIGRCKIRVNNLFSTEILDIDLPWAIPDFHFIGSKKGSFVVPPINAVVRVYFDHGDIYCPVYTVKGLREDSLPDNASLNNMVLYYTDKDDYFSIDRLTSDTVLKHSSGTKITIDPSGQVTIDAGRVQIKHKDDGQVVPDATGGPFNPIRMCPYTGIIHTGQIVVNNAPPLPPIPKPPTLIPI